ncbi:MAG: RHS repeat-associated core domain-containing protein, partial [Oscillospiraceae bacterium]
NMGLRNPLRYRGYIYDRETGLYYLQSRYYDPEIGRFINADTYTTTDADGLLSTNMFAYCENNPVMGTDPTGELWAQFAIGVASQYVGDVLGNIAGGKTGWDIFKPTSSIGEYIASGVSAMIPGSKIVSSVMRSTVSTAITEGENFIKTGNFDVRATVKNFSSNLARDILSTKVTNIVKNRIDIKRPRNYSSFAHTQYLKNPSLNRQEIYALMRRADKLADRITSAAEVMIGGVFSIRI